VVVGVVVWMRGGQSTVGGAVGGGWVQHALKTGDPTLACRPPSHPFSPGSPPPSSCTARSRSPPATTSPPPSCIARSRTLLLTGAEDTTVLLWRLAPPASPKHCVTPLPLRYLRGHVRAISAVAISADLDLAASGAGDGRVLLHTCHNGALVRSVAHPEGAAVGHLHMAALPHR
jgi:WD40 repeat protein